MATGDITEKIGSKWDVGKDEPISKFTLEIVVPQAASSKEEDIGINIVLTDLYVEMPNVDPSAATAQLDIFSERDNVIYSTGALDASGNTDTLFDGETGKAYPVHLQRALAGATTAKITCDSDISANKSFKVEFFGM